MCTTFQSSFPQEGTFVSISMPSSILHLSLGTLTAQIFGMVPLTPLQKGCSGPLFFYLPNPKIMIILSFRRSPRTYLSSIMSPSTIVKRFLKGETPSKSRSHRVLMMSWHRLRLPDLGYWFRKVGHNQITSTLLKRLDARHRQASKHCTIAQEHVQNASLDYPLMPLPLCHFFVQTSKVKLGRFASTSASLLCYFLTEQFLFAHSTVCAISLPSPGSSDTDASEAERARSRLRAIFYEIQFSSKLFCEIHNSEFLDQHIDRVADSLGTGGLLAYIQIWNHWACWCQCHMHMPAEAPLSLLLDYLHASDHLTRTGERFQTIKNAYDDTHTHIKVLRWMALKLDLPLSVALQSQTVSDFLKSQTRFPFERSEASPIPVAVLAAWELRILSQESSLLKVITLGCFLIATMASLRFRDLLPTKPESLSIQGRILRGISWRTKTSVSGQPWGVCCLGFTARPSTAKTGVPTRPLISYCPHGRILSHSQLLALISPHTILQPMLLAFTGAGSQSLHSQYEIYITCSCRTTQP